MTEPEPLTVSHAIGERMRALRQAEGVTAEDVAAAARKVGLAWRRTTVAAIEGGSRRLVAEELFLLSTILAWAGCGDGTLDQALPEGEAPVKLSDETVVHPFGLRVLLHGGADDADDFLNYPQARKDWAAGQREIERMERASVEHKRLKCLWPASTASGWREAERKARGDVEAQASRRLRVPATWVSLAAHGAWGRSLTEEREARLAERCNGDESPRAVQALRGHVTRALLDELRERLARVDDPGWCPTEEERAQLKIRDEKMQAYIKSLKKEG